MTDSEKFWGGDKGPPPTFRNVWLYWDDFLADEILGTPIVHKKKMRDKITDYYVEETLKAYPRKNRVKELYEKFKSLSRIERENFVNLIRNHVTYGK